MSIQIKKYKDKEKSRNLVKRQRLINGSIETTKFKKGVCKKQQRLKKGM